MGLYSICFGSEFNCKYSGLNKYHINYLTRKPVVADFVSVVHMSKISDSLGISLMVIRQLQQCQLLHLYSRPAKLVISMFSSGKQTFVQKGHQLISFQVSLARLAVENRIFMTSFGSIIIHRLRMGQRFFQTKSRREGNRHCLLHSTL